MTPIQSWGETWHDAIARARHKRRAVCLAIVTLLVVGLTSIGSAQEQETEVAPAVQEGRDALRDTGSYPWYDDQADDVRRIVVQPPKPASTSWSWLDFDLFSWGDWFTPMAWLFVAALASAVVFFLVRAYLMREQRAAMTNDDEIDLSVTDHLDRVDDLPMPIRRPTSDLLSEARRQYEAGNYAEAIIYLYSHQLLQLDRHHLIRLARGKTNRQYLGEIASRTGLRQLLETTMVIFEHTFFGKHPLDRSGFESAWKGLDEFDRLLEQGAA